MTRPLPGNRGGQLMRLMSVHRLRPGTDRERKEARDAKIFCLGTEDEAEIEVWLVVGQLELLDRH
jgi:hypothetical protein